MTTKKTGAQLHERSTRGEKLTDREQESLSQWYAGLDADEYQLLGKTDRVAKKVDVTAVQKQTAEALSQLESFTQRIQQLTRENDDLRREIVLLRRQVAALSNIKQPA
jgi:hypothetical protein